MKKSSCLIVSCQAILSQFKFILDKPADLIKIITKIEVSDGATKLHYVDGSSKKTFSPEIVVDGNEKYVGVYFVSTLEIPKFIAKVSIYFTAI